MALSGSTDWTLSRDQVISSALRKLGVLPSGGTPTTAQVTDANMALNAIVKAFMADGMPLWTIISTTFPTVAGQSSYNVGSGLGVDALKPMKVYQAFYTLSGGQNISMNVYNRYDFNLLPQEDVTGCPINLYHQPMRTYGLIKIWPTPDADNLPEITIHYQAPFQDMDNASDDFDFPPEWMQAIIYTLAWTLAPEYGIPPTDRGLLMKEAEHWHEYALSIGSEENSIFFQPDWSGEF